jgi:cell division protease FtsH
MKRKFKKKPNFQGNKGPGALFLLLIIIGMGLGYLFWYNSINVDRETIPFSTFLSQVESGNVKSVAVQDQQAQGEFKQGIHVQGEGRIRKAQFFDTTIASLDGLWEKLHRHHVVMEVYPRDRNLWWPPLLLLFVFFTLIGLVYFFLRQGQGGASSKIFSVGKSRARFFSPNTIKIKFKDVAGVHEAKEDLRDVIDFLKNAEKFKRLGARIPRGILLTGAPGNGKTMLAKAVAGEASCPFFSASGSDFVEVFVGVGASRVRDLFVQARRHSPCIIFIDEIDAVGRHRGQGSGSGNEEREQTLNQLLSEMDGFSTEDGRVIILAATNRPDVLDPALLRPGRFDRKVDVPYPDLVSREQILKIHMKGVRLNDSVDLKKLARGTSRFSGADLANLVNEAALVASKSDKESVDMDDFEVARDKILVGAERKTLTRTEEEIKRTAYHEAGHTLAMVLAPETQPLHKVTILSRGGALGITWYLPEGDEVSRSEDHMKAEIMVCLGGRVAEELVYGAAGRTTGAFSDLKTASQLAKDMVCRYGMSDLGLITLHEQPGHKEYSEETAHKIDETMKDIINDCYKATKKLIGDNKEKLDRLVNELIDKETLDASEVYKLLDVKPRKITVFKKNDKLESESNSDDSNEKPADDDSIGTPSEA